MKPIGFMVFVAGVVCSANLVAATFPDTSQTAAGPPQTPRFVLVPTTAGSSVQSGVVELGGPANAVTDLSVRIQQLAPGLYWVVMVRKSDGRAVILAPVNVFDTADFEPDRRAGADPEQRTSGHQVTVLQTQAVIKLPNAFDSGDVAQLLVEDINNAPVLKSAPAGESSVK